jgi:hypothetical protein
VIRLVGVQRIWADPAERSRVVSMVAA